MATLWNKGTSCTADVEEFTVGNDRELDLRLARYDILGSKAHIAMLESVGLLKRDELELLLAALDRILASVENGSFRLEEDVEDIHSQVELLLTRELGDLGKKIHSGRSRNDQVLVDIKLFLKDEVLAVRSEMLELSAGCKFCQNRTKTCFCPDIRTRRLLCPRLSVCGSGLMRKRS